MKKFTNRKILLFLVLSLLAFPVAALSSNYILQKAPIQEMILEGGVIRLDYDGPFILSNKTHIAVGLNNLYIDERGDLVIIRDAENASLVSIDVTLDEDLAGRGISCGVSGGGFKTIVVFYNKDGQKLDLNNFSEYSQIAGPYANIFVSFIAINNDYVSQFLPEIPEVTPEDALTPPIEEILPTEDMQDNTQADPSAQENNETSNRNNNQSEIQ